MIKKLRLFLLLAVFGLLTFTAPAAAGEKEIAQMETLPGEICVVVETNGESVWPGNYLLIRDGDTEYRIDGVEDAPNLTLEYVFVAQTESVTATVVFETWSSLDVEIECAPPSTTTTTEPPPPSTTVPEPTTSTSESTVPTTEATTTTSSSVPEPETTTTTVPQHDTTTTTIDRCAEPGSCLPDTGAETPVIMAFGLLSVVLGLIALVAREIRL